MSGNIIQDKSFQFALDVIALYCRLQESREFILSKQVLRSGTSIGANVEEALAGQSRKDFISKLHIATKEARETTYWLRLLRESKLVEMDLTREMNAVEEILRILSSIILTTKQGPGSP